MTAMRRAAAVILAAALAGCRGTVPERNVDPALGFSAILVQGRFLAPAGEAGSGFAALNLEMEGGETYRLPFPRKETALYAVEPGVYRLFPTRNLFGHPQTHLRVTVNGRNYTVPFPRNILRLDPITIKPRKMVSIGILEVKLSQPPGKPASVSVTLDDSVAARRKLVEDLIGKMMDPNVPVSIRDNVVQWTRALDQALVDIQESQDVKPSYKPSE